MAWRACSRSGRIWEDGGGAAAALVVKARGPTGVELTAVVLRARGLPFISGARAIIEMLDVRTSGEVRRLGPVHLVVLAAWCGLAAGELEVAVRFLHRTFGSTHRLFLMTRHFVWLIPLVDLALFLAAGAMLALAARRWPRRAGWLGPRLFVALALLPALTWPALGSTPRPGCCWRSGRLAGRSGAGAAAGPLAAAAGADRPGPAGAGAAPGRLAVRLRPAQAVAQEARPPPPAGAPNVLLIVLDTVRADHVSLYGYPRPTTPNLQRLAGRGIRFDRARAAAPWTLASHASMFTGQWPHELAVEWMSPLRGDVPTLAEHLGSLGYATAGFVGNTFYASYDTGLDRGFTHYEDYVLDGMSAARTAKALDDSFKSIGELGRMWHISGRAYQDLTHGKRKDARAVNREFLEWLTRRRAAATALLRLPELRRCPLALPAPAGGLERPRRSADHRSRRAVAGTALVGENRRRFPGPARRLARDAYDNCLAFVDARLGELVDELERRGVLEQTLVIVTADHGEELGEHDAVRSRREPLSRRDPRAAGDRPARGPRPIPKAGGRRRAGQPPRPGRDGRRLRPPGDDVAIPGPVTAGADPRDGRRLRRRQPPRG